MIVEWDCCHKQYKQRSVHELVDLIDFDGLPSLGIFNEAAPCC